MNGLLKKLSLLLVPFGVGCFIESGEAEFLKAGPFTYHDTNQKVAVVVAPPSDDTPIPGIFIVTHLPTPPQLFDPGKLPTISASSVFLEFDPDSKNFSTVYLGKQQFTVRGNFAIQLFDGLVRVALQKRFKNSLLTVAVKSEGEQRSLLGFVGMKEAFSFSEKEAAGISPRLFEVGEQGAIQDYLVNANHQLTLQEAEVTTSFIGLFAEEGKGCLAANAIIPAIEDWAKINGMKKEDLANIPFDNEIKTRAFSPSTLWPFLSSVSGKEDPVSGTLVLALPEAGSAQLLHLAENASVNAPDGSTAIICRADAFGKRD